MSGYVPTTEQRDEIEDALLDYGMEREDSVFSFRATTPGFEGAVDRIVAVLAEARREGWRECALAIQGALDHYDKEARDV